MVHYVHMLLGYTYIKCVN